jgi:hypothetical protein
MLRADSIRNQLLISVKPNSSSDFVSSGSATYRDGFFLSSTISITLYHTSVASRKNHLCSWKFFLPSLKLLLDACWVTRELALFLHHANNLSAQALSNL